MAENDTDKIVSMDNDMFADYSQIFPMVVLVLVVRDNDSTACNCEPLLLFLVLIQKTGHI